MIEFLRLTGSSRRFAVLGLVLAVLSSLAVALAGGADAECDPNNGDCNPGGGGTTYYSVLTVTPPAVGTVYGTVSGQSTNVIACSASGGTCTVTDTQIAYVRPTDGWPTYDFTYTGPAGYSVAWSGACSGSGSCWVLNDQATATLNASSHDIQPPSVSLNAPARVGPSTQLTATASDNDRVSRLDWRLCQADHTGCSTFGSGSPVTVGYNRASGNYLLEVWAYDPAGNIGSASAQVTYVAGVLMTWQTLPDFTEAPSFSFHSDDETHVPYDDAHRQCRAFPYNGTPSAWGPCTTWTSYAPQLPDGHWTLQAQEIDDLGLSGTTWDDTVVDTTLPSVELTDGPAEGSTVATTGVTLGFTASDTNLDSVTCALDDAAPTGCTSPYPLAGYGNGQHTFTVTATDVLGHTSSATRTFAVAVPTSVTPARARFATVYGHPARLSARVQPDTATGKVRFATAAGRVLCTATVAAGTASCTAPARLAPAAMTVVARYVGNYSPSQASTKLLVTKAPTTLHARAARSVRHGARLPVAVRGLPRAATGTIVVRIGTRTLCRASVHNGRGRCPVVADLTPGHRYTLQVRYGGNTFYRASAATIRIRVTR